MSGKEMVSLDPSDIRTPSLYTLDTTTLRPVNTQNDFPKIKNQEENKQDNIKNKELMRVFKKGIRYEKLIKLFEDFQNKEKDKGNNDSTTDITKKFVDYLDKEGKLQYLSDDEKYNIFDLISKSTQGTDEKIRLMDNFLSGKKMSFIKNLIGKRTPENKKQLLNQLRTCFRTIDIITAVGYDWNSSINYLAKKAGINDYETSLNDNAKNAKYNEKIRDRFLNKMLEINEIHTETNKFLKPELQTVLENTSMKDNNLIEISEDLDALTDRQKEELNSLTPARFEQFLLSLSDKGKEIGKTVEDKFGVSEQVGKNLGICLALSNGDILDIEKTEIFVESTKEAKEEIEKQIAVNDAEIIQYYKVIEKPLPIQPSLERELTEQHIRNKKIEEYAEKNSKIKPEALAKIKELNQKYESTTIALANEYGFTKELRTVRGEEYYVQVEQRYIQQQTQVAEKYQSGDSGKELRNIGQRLVSQKEFTEFFDANRIGHEDLQGSLSNEEYLQLLSKDKNGQQENIQKSKENNLLNITNAEVKNRFVERLTYFLGNVLDIQLDKDGKENILKGLNIDEKNIDKNVITIQGKYQNKDLTFTYNIQTGDLFTGKWLHKEKNSQATIVGQKMEKLNTVSGPTFGEHFAQAKSISYADILKKSEGDENNFQKEIQKELFIKCPLPDQSDSFKEEMKLHNLKNIVAQEMFEMIGIKDKQRPTDGIDGSQNPLFPLLARSIETYNKDEILQMRNIIQNINDFYSQQRQIDTITSKKESINPKLQELSKETKDDKYKPLKTITKTLFALREKEQNNANYTGNQFQSFFESFLSDQPQSKEGEKIVDISKLYTYVEDLQQVENKQINKDYFATLQENMSQYFAESDLDNKWVS